MNVFTCLILWCAPKPLGSVLPCRHCWKRLCRIDRMCRTTNCWTKTIANEPVIVFLPNSICGFCSATKILRWTIDRRSIVIEALDRQVNSIDLSTDWSIRFANELPASSDRDSDQTTSASAASWCRSRRRTAQRLAEDRVPVCPLATHWSAVRRPFHWMLATLVHSERHVAVHRAAPADVVHCRSNLQFPVQSC